jgi:putative nucleotidyltransferase with HDIG domain
MTKINLHILTSRFARRIFFVFFLCALIPVCGLAVIAYQHVSRQLDEQFRTNLKHSVKTYSFFLYERFLNLETELTLAATHLGKIDDNVSIPLEKSYLERLQKHFSALLILRRTGDSQVLYGRIGEITPFSEREITHLKTGQSFVKYAGNSTEFSDLLMVVPLDAKRFEAGFLVAKANPVYLLALNREFHLPSGVELLIRDESSKVLYSSTQKDIHSPGNLSEKQIGKNSGDFEFKWENEIHLACYRWIFMEPKFLFSGFNITFIQSKTNAFLQMVEFRKIFPQVLLLSLLVTIILSIYFIRRSLEPLKRLKEGTRQITESNFNHRVEIDSRDEFEELAEAFNQMAVQLNNQFNTLETSAQITHAVLSSLDTNRILETVISRMTDCFACEAVAIGLVNSRNSEKIECYVADNNDGGDVKQIDRKLPPGDLIRFHKNEEFLTIEEDRDLPDYLSIFDDNGFNAYLLLPVFLDAHLSAIIMLAYRNTAVLKIERLRGRQMANQVAVALSNSRLMEKLTKLNWGTLRALARAVDAKSPWTAGHSGRVTRLALKLAEVLIPDPRERENLHRAALLHDIGKLGIPAAILDKPGKLTDQEYETIKTHPQIGARILKPIEEYASIIPVVLHHHERFDGKGYPKGLEGNSIPFGARILAVADVFDAMKSDRPYRSGMPLERVMGIIQEESGRQFDPEVVEALRKVIYSNAAMAA